MRIVNYRTFYAAVLHFHCTNSIFVRYMMNHKPRAVYDRGEVCFN